MLPDGQRFARMLVTAAEDRIADVLSDHVSQGMDTATACRIAATILAEATMLAPEACSWVVAELAIALGLTTGTLGTPTIVPQGTRRTPVGQWAGLAGDRQIASASTESAPHQAPASDRHGPAGHRLTAYVAARQCLTPVDLATGTPGTPIRLTRNASAIAITPDGAIAYAVTSKVIPISLGIRATGPPIDAGKRPAAIAITPDGMTAYVVSSGDGTVTPISVATSAPGTPINAVKGLTAIAITPDGTTAYVAAHRGWIMPIDLSTGSCVTPIAIESGLADIAIDPDGLIAYVTSPHGVTPISISTGRRGSLIKVQGGPGAIAITPDGTTAYVLAHGSAVVPIDLATSMPRAPISIGFRVTGRPRTVGERPRAIAITPDGTIAYVLNEGDGTVTPISLAKGAVGVPIKVGHYAYAMAIAITK
jgi:hypothetical protein